MTGQEKATTKTPAKKKTKKKQLAKKTQAKLKPVTVDGISFDGLVSEGRSYSADVPTYTVENGFAISDSINLKPLTVSLVLLVSTTPGTWYKKNGHSMKRPEQICSKMEKKFFARKLVKVVTNSKIYTNMAITSMSIDHTKELGYSRQITLSLQKVNKTKRKTVTIPKTILKAGKTKAKAGKANTSKSSKNKKAQSKSSKSGSQNTSGSKGNSNSGSNTKSNSKNKGSILYQTVGKYL